MISPINLSTQGLLNSPLAVAAIRGRLIILVEEAEDVGGGSSKRRTGLEDPRNYTYRVTPEQLDKLKAQLEREDDEILAIVMAAMEVLQ